MPIPTTFDTQNGNGTEDYSGPCTGKCFPPRIGRQVKSLGENLRLIKKEAHGLYHAHDNGRLSLCL